MTPYTLACKARPSSDGCRTSLSVSLSLSLSLSLTTRKIVDDRSVVTRRTHATSYRSLASGKTTQSNGQNHLVFFHHKWSPFYSGNLICGYRVSVPLSSGRRDRTSSLSSTHPSGCSLSLFRKSHCDQSSDTVRRSQCCQRFHQPALAVFGRALDLNFTIVSFNQIDL